MGAIKQRSGRPGKPTSRKKTAAGGGHGAADPLRPDVITDMASLIAGAFVRSQRQGLSKAAQLYEAVSSLVGSGLIADGTKIPGERELCVATGLSLGTVQKALSALTSDGDLVREHGRGTFARSARSALKELWHYRFRHPERNELLPVYATVESREHVAALPAQAAALGEDRTGYVRIVRLINIDDRFSCWSEMYLRASRFGLLLEMPMSKLEGANLKQLLHDEFNAPTLAISQTVRVERPAAEIATKIGVGKAGQCLVTRILATSRHREPITFQAIVVPPVDYELELTAAPFEVAKARAA